MAYSKKKKKRQNIGFVSRATYFIFPSSHCDLIFYSAFYFFLIFSVAITLLSIFIVRVLFHIAFCTMFAMVTASLLLFMAVIVILCVVSKFDRVARERTFYVFY